MGSTLELATALTTREKRRSIVEVNATPENQPFPRSVSRPRLHPARLLTALGIVLLSPGCSGGESYGDKDDCGHTFCGCTSDRTVDRTFALLDDQDDPISGAQLRCSDSESLLARTDSAGLARIVLETTSSPGCGIDACRIVTAYVASDSIGAIDLNHADSTYSFALTD